MTVVGSVSIFRRKIETEPAGEQKSLVRKAFETPEKENGSNGRENR